MQEEFVTLKWGDIVRIHGVNNAKKQSTKGLIISKGFTDTNIYYQTYTDFSNVNFYRQSLFQVLPKINFETHDQLMKQNITQQQKQNLRGRAQNELQLLQTTLAAKAGKQITYSSQVIFRHIQSKAYLFGMMKAANSGEGAFSIEVSNQISSDVIFKLISPRSFQNQNDKIYFNDALKIYHINSGSYMNFSGGLQQIYLDQKDYYEEIPQQHPFKVFSGKRPFIKTPINIRTFIMNQNKAKCLWKFIQHCSYEEYNNKEKIKSHDIVYFKHTRKDEESLVSTTISQPLTALLKKNQSGGLSYECFWQLIPKQVNEFGPEQCNRFLARNIVTGQLLTFDQCQVQIQPNIKTDTKGFDNRGLINLVCSKKGEQEKSVQKLQRGKQISIGQNSTIPQIQKHYENKSRKFELIKVDVLPKDIFMIFKVDQELLLDAMYVISSHEFLVKFVQKLSSKLLSMERAESIIHNFPVLFQIFKQQQLANIVKILKMLAGKVYNTDFDNILTSGNTPNQNVQRILIETGIVQILIEILHHLYQPFKFIQKNSQPSQDRAIRVKILEIFQHTYILLQKVAANFEQNRIYISRWMDLFLQHSNNVNKSFIQECLVGILKNNPIAIKNTINQDKINNLISNFLQQASKNKDQPLTTKYLRLFSTFIVCENYVIKQNQDIILNNFFKNPKNQLNFKFKVQYKNEGIIDDQNDPYKVKSKQVLIAFGGEGYISFVQFFSTHRNQWNYLMEYINLLADICKDRNNNSIQSVSSILSLQAVAVILFDHQIAEITQKIKDQNHKLQQAKKEKFYSIQNIHEPFIRIAHHVYVDNQKFQEIKRIKRISKWYKNSDQQSSNPAIQDINRTNRVFQGQKQQQQEKYLQSVLEYIKNYIKDCNQDVANLKMLNTVLSLLKSTIILGLWRSIKFFRELAPQLMLKITKIQNNFFFQQDSKVKQKKKNVQKNKQKLKMNKPQISQSIGCKILAIQIFKYINDLQVDIRVRYIMNFFKGLYYCTENFNVYDQPIKQQLAEDANQQQIDRNLTAMEQYLKMEGKALFGDQVKKLTQDVDIHLKQNIWYHKLRQLTPFEYTKQEDPMKDRYIFQGDSDPDGQNYEKQLNHQFSKMVLGLFQLSAYQDYKLLDSSLNMLRIIFEQRKDLIFNFKKVLICGKGNLQEVYLTLKFMREKFNMLANSSILNYQGDFDKTFPYAIKKPYDYLIKDRQKRSGIVEDLFFLARTLKDGTSLKNIQSLMSVDDEIFEPDYVYNFINQKQKNNPLFQSLNLAEGIYKPLFEYIKIIGDKNIQSQRKLLLSIYQYLTLLCFNNLEAKQILMPYIQYILPHLKSKVGAASFLYEVTRNNKILVSNQPLVTLIIKKSLENCLQLQRSFAVVKFLMMDHFQIDNNNNDFEKSRILFALRGILLYNDQGHKRNQQLLMNCLQKNQYNKLVFVDDINYKSNLNDFNLSPSETYIVYHFQLFSVLVESGNMINIGKLQNLHAYQYCLENLANTNRWQIRRALRAYINRLYYVNKDKDIFLFQKFISREFDILNNQLGDLVQLHRKKLISEDLKLKNGIRFSYAQSQIFLFIIQCLITLHQIFLKPLFIEILKRQLIKDEKNADLGKPLHQNFIKLFKNLGCIKRIYDKVKIIDPFIRQVKNLMSGIIIQMMNVRYLQKKAQPEDNNNSNEPQEQNNQNPNSSVDLMEKKNYSYDHSKSFFRNLCTMIKFLKYKEHMDHLKQTHQKNKKQVNVPERQLKLRYIQTIFSVPNQKLKPYFTVPKQKKVMHYNPHLQTASSRIVKVLAKQQLGQNQQNIELNNRLNQVKTMIEDSPTFDKFKDDEFIFFVNKTLDLDKTSTEEYSQYWKQLQEGPSPVVPINQIFQKIFKLIMQNPKKIDDQQKIFVIKLIRCFITEAVQGKQLYKRSVDKWDADYFDQDQNFSNRQNQIASCGGSDFIISIFKQNLTGRTQLLNQALLLGIAYLYGGNHNCQNSILSSLKKDHENVMMINIKNIIKNIGDFLINVRKIKQNQKKRNFAYNIVDTYDYFNSEDKMICKYFSQVKVDKFQVQIQLDNQKALCRMFRFLQLFCQNNNKDMKKFLYCQINEDESPKTNTINFIEQTAILLKKMFKIMNNKLVMIPNNLLAFIGQITQVPIIQNQISFIKTTFFEDISYMATFFDSPENKLQRKFNLVAQDDDDPLNTLSQIYKQAVGLALGNFQGNQSIIVNQFLNKCQPKLLWLIVRDQLWTLIKTKYSHMSFYQTDEKGDIQSRRKTFQKLNPEAISQIIKEQKKQKTFDGPIASIIEVLIIFRKIEDFAKVKQMLAIQNKQNPIVEDSAQAQKARLFKKNFIQIASEELLYNKQKNIENTIHMIGLLDELILQIQINCFNGNSEKLQNIYFCNHPVFKYLASTSKDQIMVDVTRDTPRDKLISLLSFRKDVYDQISWNFDMNFYSMKVKFLGKQFEKSIPITSDLCQKVRRIANICSYIIIAFMFYMILAEHQVDEVLTTYFTYSNWRQRLILKVLCTLQLILMILYLLLWYRLRGQLVFNKYLNNLQQQEAGGQKQIEAQQIVQQQQQNQQNNDNAVEQQKQQNKDNAVEQQNNENPVEQQNNENPVQQQRQQNNDNQVELIGSSQIQKSQKKSVIFYMETLIASLNKAYKATIKLSKKGIKFIRTNQYTSKVIQTFIRAKNYVYNVFLLRFFALWSESQFKSILLFLVTSILGNFYGIQWYTTHLFNLFVGVPQLINVFKAIINNIKLLAILSLLATAFVVVFNVLSLNTYTPVIYEEELPQQACSSILNCVLVVYTSGAINDDMSQFQFFRFSFDLIYVVFIQLLFQNLVGGIMIDAYTSLTSQDSDRDQDKKGKCYICSMQKPFIQKLGQTFKKHTERHYLWNYIYYIFCLQNKDPTDYTGIQYIISKLIQQQDVSWFPSQKGDEQGNNVQDLMLTLKQSIETLKKNQKKFINRSKQAIDQSLKKLKPNQPVQ